MPDTSSQAKKRTGKNTNRVWLAASCWCLLTSSTWAADTSIQLGPRPYFLVSQMKPSALKDRLQACANQPLVSKEFSIGHRGAPLMFPEHTRESYQAAAAMGAGIVECDVTFTKDKELVCRHSQSDLHTTTNILLTPLAAKCTKAFQAFDPVKQTPAGAECRTSDITLAEFKSLRGKMDGFDPRALTPEEYVRGTPDRRTALYNGQDSGTLMSHAESIQLFKRLGVKMAPELKEAVIPMPFEQFSQQDYAQKMLDEYKTLKVKPGDVFAQSFHLHDLLYWIKNEPLFARQAVFLEVAATVAELPDLSRLQYYKAQGIHTVAPPIFALLEVDGQRLVPSRYARDVKAAGLGLISWSLERSDLRARDGGGWYYQGLQSVVQHEGDVFEVLHVLAEDVGIRAMFSDWPATTTFYANCMQLN